MFFTYYSIWCTLYTVNYSDKNRHNPSVPIVILPKHMHMNGLFLNITKLKVNAPKKRTHCRKRKQGTIWGESNMVHSLTPCAVAITYFSEKCKAGLKEGSAAIHNLFREDINFLYFRVPENKSQSPEIKGIGLPITEPAEHDSQCVKLRGSQKRNPSKEKPFTCWACLLQSCHLHLHLLLWT